MLIYSSFFFLMSGSRDTKAKESPIQTPRGLLRPNWDWTEMPTRRKKRKKWQRWRTVQVRQQLHLIVFRQKRPLLRCKKSWKCAQCYNTWREESVNADLRHNRSASVRWNLAYIIRNAKLSVKTSSHRQQHNNTWQQVGSCSSWRKTKNVLSSSSIFDHLAVLSL